MIPVVGEVPPVFGSEGDRPHGSVSLLFLGRSPSVVYLLVWPPTTCARPGRAEYSKFEEVAALVVAGGSCDADELKAFARERVAAYAYPRLVVIVDDLPRTATGKVLRRAIDRAALAEQLTAVEDQTASRPT